MKHFEQTSEQEFKEEFIKWFGEDKWNQLERISTLAEVSECLCSYLGVEEIPIICETIKEDSRYYPKEQFIIISDKVIMNEVEALKCLIHEIRHHYQYTCVSTNNLSEQMLEQWKEEFKTLYQDSSIQLCSMLEIDAYAFTKFIMKEWFNQDIIHYDETYEKVINLYMSKYVF